VAGRIQDRLGPTRVGGKFGWLQTLADGIKLLCKEDTIPASADHMLFRLGPYIVLVASFLAFMALPFGIHMVGVNMNVALFYILAVLSAEVFGVILIGYGSGSKWSLFGGMREAAQMVSYEVPMAISIIVPVIAAGSMNLTEVVTGRGSVGADQQMTLYGPGHQYGIWNWLIFRDPFTFCAFWLYFTCATASCKRAPFDLAEAESELVAGFHTEYSGFRWLSIFMAEYGSMVVVSGIAAIMFLGGWSTGLPWELTHAFSYLFGAEWGTNNIPGFWVGNAINVAVFILKCWFLVFIMMWVRWTLPRLRIDQVMMTCLKYILPLSCFLLLGVSAWYLFVPAYAEVVAQYFRFALLAVLAVWVVYLIFRWLTFTQAPPSSAMPGMLRTTGSQMFQGTRPR
jgi:NADH-quinone oxidoreductase subunit H